MLHKYHLEPRTVYTEFVAVTSRYVGSRKNRTLKEEIYKFNVMIDDQGCWCTNYGYDHKVERDLHEGFDSMTAGETYDLHHIVRPKEGDVLYHPKSGRKFVLGKVEGCVNYYAPILENGKQVSTLHFEEYYKD